MPRSAYAAAGPFEPFAAAHLPWEVFSRDTLFGIGCQPLRQSDGGARSGVCVEILEAGRRAYPAL